LNALLRTRRQKLERGQRQLRRNVDALVFVTLGERGEVLGSERTLLPALFRTIIGCGNEKKTTRTTGLMSAFRARS